jgi:hypothetical protein
MLVLVKHNHAFNRQVYYPSIHKIKRFRDNVCTFPNDKIIVENGGPYDDTPHTISTLRHLPLGCTRAEAEWAVALNRVLAGELTWVNRCCYGTRSAMACMGGVY